MRFYVSPEAVDLRKKVIQIGDRQEIHHIRDVMRLRKGTAVDIFDGTGKEYAGTIAEVTRGFVSVEIISVKQGHKVISFKATLYQAIPKKDKMDFIVEKAVELGIDAIVPVVTERAIPLLKEKARARVSRWRRVAQAAAKQCGRVELPDVSDLKSFEEAISGSGKADLVILAALDKRARPLKEILKQTHAKDISIFVGPEGDFSPKEITMAKEKGCVISSLGQLVLRVETAAIYILSCLNYEYNT